MDKKQKKKKKLEEQQCENDAKNDESLLLNISCAPWKLMDKSEVFQMKNCLKAQRQYNNNNNPSTGIKNLIIRFRVAVN